MTNSKLTRSARTMLAKELFQIELSSLLLSTGKFGLEKKKTNLKFVSSATPSQIKVDIAMCFLIVLLRIPDICGSTPGSEDYPA